MTPRPSWWWDGAGAEEGGAYEDDGDHEDDGDDDSDCDDPDGSLHLLGNEGGDPDRTRYYTRLHLAPNCEPWEISRAYKALSRVVHPDKAATTGVWMTPTTPPQSSSASEKEDAIQNGADEQIYANDAAITADDDDLRLRSAAEDAFVELQRCAEVLSDPILRLAYDAGGVPAVRLVQRSQQQPQHPPHDTPNLHEKLRQAHNRDEAIAILRQALDEHRRRERQNHRGAAARGGKHSGRGRLQLDASLTSPYAGWEREGGANLSVVAKRHMSARHSVHATASHRLQHRGFGQVSGSVGTEFVVASSSAPPPSSGSSGNDTTNNRGAAAQSGGTTTYAMDARFTDAPRTLGVPSPKTVATATASAAPFVSFRTSRQLATGTTWVWGVSGRIQDRRTWNYTLVSHRLLQLPWPWWGTVMPWNTTRRPSYDDDDHRHSDEPGKTEPPPPPPPPPPLRVHAMWRGGWQAATQRLGFVVAQFRTIGTSGADPQYRLRLAPTTPYPFKVSYRGCSGTAGANSTPTSSDEDEPGTWTVTYSAGWGLLWNRLKVTRSVRVWGSAASSSQWVCRYGLKYDGRALLTMLPTAGNALGAGPDGAPTLWTLLLHLHSSEWSIRIPVHLTAAGVVPPSAAGMVNFLVCQWLLGMLEGWAPDNRNKFIAARGASAASTAEAGAPLQRGVENVIASMTTTAPDVVRHVAAKKRAQELQSNGLVILSVAVNGERRESLTEALQFWVNGGSLNVPMLHVVQPSAESQRPPERELLWRRWWVRWAPPPPAPSEVSRTPVRLDLRYQYRGFVYDAQFTGDDEHLVLPVKEAGRATRLGRSHQVQ